MRIRIQQLKLMRIRIRIGLVGWLRIRSQPKEPAKKNTHKNEEKSEEIF
jgi:hypothetical protein